MAQLYTLDEKIRKGRRLLAAVKEADAAREGARLLVEDTGARAASPRNDATYRQALRRHAAAVDAADRARGALIRHLARYNLTTSDLA